MQISKYKLGNIGKKIVFLSDIHYYNKKIIPKLNIILNEIEKLKPDYIVIGGDLVDGPKIKDKKYLIEYIKKLTLIAPLFFAFGNHECEVSYGNYTKYDRDLFDKLKKIDNFNILDGKTYSIDNINFIGFNVPLEYYKNNEDAKVLISYANRKFKKLKEGYNIIINHSPYRIARKEVLDKFKCRDDINLILSGHMHDGMVLPLFKNKKGRGIITPSKKLFRKYCYGSYDYKNIKIIISGGVTKLAKSHKFPFLNKFFKSEIVYIEI